MIDAVHRYDGYLVQSTGDGIFALFGAPLAHEDHPRRAVYSALRMQEDIRSYGGKLQEEGRAPIEIRVGINSGEVVVRSLRTGDAHTEYTPIGHTANLASRLQAIARTGSIVFSDKTRGLVEGYFALRSLGATRVKGIAEPVKLYEVNGLGPLRTPFQRAAARGLTRFVGRERELDAMRQALELAKAGRGQIVAAMGEPGVGKSRLFFEFKAIAQSDCAVLEAYSISHGKASAYLPLIELLRDYFRITPEDDQRQRREKITGKVLTLERALEDTLPYLFAVLGLNEEGDAVAVMDPQLRSRRTQEALKRILLCESINQPLIVIFEDLHWIDEHTQDFLNLLADAIGTAKILLLVNYRPEYSHRWSGKSYYMQLRLDPLNRESAEEILSALLGDAAELIPLKRRIIQTTEGNPFFLEEMVQELFEEGTLHRNGVVKVTRSLPQVHVPPTVQGILASRVDRLPQSEKEFLQTVAVLGREFSLSLARQVTAKADEELEQMLANLQVREFIYEQPAFPEVEYTFKHALTQEVAYNSVLNERRRILHERAGAALEHLFGGRLEEHVHELARHYERSSNVDKAVHYLALAAHRNGRQGLLAEGIEQTERALRLIEALPETRERVETELDLLTTLVAVTGFKKGYASPEVVELIERAATVSRRLDDNRKLFSMLPSLFLARAERGELGRVDEILNESRNVAAKTGDGTYVTAALAVDACFNLWLGRLVQARANSEQSIIDYDRGGQPIAEWYLQPDVYGRYAAAWALWLLGYPDRALARAGEAVAPARSPGPINRACGLHALAEVCVWRGELERARQAAREELELCMNYGITGAFVSAEDAIATLGFVLVLEGKFDAGLAELRRAVDQMNRRGQKLLVPLFLLRMAIGYLGTGDIRAASEAIAQARALASKTGERVWDAELRRIEGVIAGKQERPNDAEQTLRDAIKIARSQEAKSWELRATTSLALLLGKQDRRAEARTMLAEICGWFIEGFDTADLREAKALLEEVK
jgi:tetratricopeptide (TPR) repeat protein